MPDLSPEHQRLIETAQAQYDHCCVIHDNPRLCGGDYPCDDCPDKLHRETLDAIALKLARLERLEEAIAAWDATLSSYCDGPERDAVRALLAAREEEAT